MRTALTLTALTTGTVLALVPATSAYARQDNRQTPSSVWVGDGSGHCGGWHQYATITDAVAAVAPGGTVHVCPGTYHEDVLVDKAIRLVGEDAWQDRHDGRDGSDDGDDGDSPAVTVSPDATDATFLTGPTGGNNAFTVTSPNVTIDNFTVENATGDGIFLAGDHGLVKNVLAQNNVINGINVDGSSHSVVRDNHITNNGGGIELANDEIAAGLSLPGVSGTAAWDRIEDNDIVDNPSACAIYLVDHAGSATPGDATGIHDNLIRGNYVARNALKGFGAGVLMATPAPGGSVYNNRITDNIIDTNGLPGVAVHSHLPGQDLNGNVVARNNIGTNNILGVETGDTQTTGVFIGTHDPLTITVRDNTIHDDHFGIYTAGPVTVTGVRSNRFRHDDVRVDGTPTWDEPPPGP